MSYGLSVFRVSRQLLDRVCGKNDVALLSSALPAVTAKLADYDQQMDAPNLEDNDIDISHADALREIETATYVAPSLGDHSYLNPRLVPWLPEDQRAAAERGLRQASARDFEGATDGLAQLCDPAAAEIAAAATTPCAWAAWTPPKRAPSPMAKTSPTLVRPSALVSVSIEPLPRGTKRWAQPSARASSDDEAKP